MKENPSLENVADVKQSLILSAVGALFDHVTPNLRETTIAIHEDVVILNFYYDKALDEDEEELVSLAYTEFIAGLPPIGYKLDCKIILLPYPSQKVSGIDSEICIYCRYEAVPHQDTFNYLYENNKNVSNANLLIAAVRALLCRITPNLRRVIVNLEEDVCAINMVYDQPPSELENLLTKQISNEFIAAFPVPKFKTECKSTVLPHPAKVDNFIRDGIYAYARHEPILELTVKESLDSLN